MPTRPIGEGDHALPDGTTVRLRSIRPDDKTRLLQMWARTSEESRRRRFLGAYKVTEANIARFTDLDPDQEQAIVATLGRGENERIVGVARYRRFEDDPATADFAALVEDAHQGRGIGATLIRHLAVAARDAGVTRLTGDILADNTRMLDLIRDLGLAYRRDGSGTDGGVVHTELGLDETPAFLERVAAGEKRAARSALERFFAPRRVAVVGASRDPSSVGGLLFGNLIHGGYQGVVYPVNPRAESIQGVAAYPTLSDCPQVPDLAVVAVPAPVVNDVVDEAGQLGIKAVCVISAGFAEAGEDDRQRDLIERARGHGLRVIGPNCMGLLNASPDVRMNATFSQVFPRAGRLAFSSQSGALGLAVLEHAERLGLGMSTFVSVGNKADLSGNDLLLFWEDDDDTDVILLYLESFGNPRRFSRIARRISRRKPVVAVKSGRTRAGARAASSHTGALAAGDVAVDALFRQTGVIRTETLEEMFGVAGLLSRQPLPSGPRVAVLTNAGGPGILAADACESNGLEVPALSDKTRERLREFLPPAAGIANPVDMIASGTPEQYGRAMRVLADAEEIDALFVIFIPVGLADSTAVAEALAGAAADIPADKPVVSVFMSAQGVPAALAGTRIPSFAFPEDAARALGRVAAYADWRSRPLGDVVRPDGIDAEAARAVVEAALQPRPDGDTPHLIGRSHATAAAPTSAPVGTATSGAWLTTAEAVTVLDAYGIAQARSRVVHSPEEGAEAQRSLDCPVAVKAASPIHKTDVGAITLGLESPEQVADAIADMRGRLEESGMHGDLGGWLVQEMIRDGVEMAVGVTHDPSFGPLVMAGMGGTLIELLRDVAVRITPLTDSDVDDMLGQLRMRPLLYGYRGAEPVDVDALRDLLHRVNALVDDLPEIAELDLNPVFVRHTGVTAVDVRIRVDTLAGD